MIAGLRDYQARAIQDTYRWLNANEGNPCIVAPTGSGKSHLIAAMCEDLLKARPEGRIIVLSHVKELLVQDAEKILAAWPEAPLGIYSAGLGRRDINAITVAGIQSIYRRADEVGHIGLIIADEAHLINNESRGMYRSFIGGLKEINPALRVIGLTATPYRLGQGMITDGGLFDALIESISIDELVERGYLARLRSKFTDMELNVEGVRKRGGEFVGDELQARVNTESANSAIVDETIRRAEDRQAWLVFCAGVGHAVSLRDAFLARGIATEIVTGDTPKEERAYILDEFKAGRVRAITNVNVLCLDEETEILTSTGFVGIDEMTPEHMIAAWKKDGGIEFTPPETIIRRNREPGENMVCLGGRMAANIRVTANHRMVIKCGVRRRKIKIVSAESLIGKSCTIPAFGESLPMKTELPQKQSKVSFSRQVIAVAYNYRQKGIEAKEARVKAEEFVRRVRDLKYKSPHELTLDECMFIGFWLGDGTKSGGRYSISQSFVYEDNIIWAENLFEKIGIHYSKNVYPQKGNMRAPAIRWNFSRGTGGDGQYVEGGYYPYEPYLQKEGTKLFLSLNKEQLLALLEGLWKADGVHHGKDNTKTHYITSTALSLLDILQAACSMRGISAVISKASPPRKNNHRQQYRFSWGGRNDWSYTKESSFLETEYKPERVWCVTSSTSFLICRRQGHVFVTGNTTGFDYPNIDLLVMARPTLSPGLYLQMAGRGMRPKTGTYRDCLVLDFAGNIARHGPVTDVEPPTARDAMKQKRPVKKCPECQEAVPMRMKVCPCCGYEFPQRETEKDFELNQTEDIMGAPVRMDVRGWKWDVVNSRKNGTPMLRVTFYGNSSLDEPKSLYLCLMHGGYAAEKGQRLLHSLTGRYLPEPDEFKLHDVAEDVNARRGVCPAWVEYRRRGRFYDIIKWGWEAANEAAV